MTLEEAKQAQKIAKTLTPGVFKSIGNSFSNMAAGIEACTRVFRATAEGTEEVISHLSTFATLAIEQKKAEMLASNSSPE